MPQALLAGFLAAFLVVAAAPPAVADDRAPDRVGPGEMLEDATRRIMAVLEMVMRSIPQYEMPEILENGDIIIRRKHPEAPGEEAPPRRPGPSAPPAKPI